MSVPTILRYALLHVLFTKLIVRKVLDPGDLNPVLIRIGKEACGRLWGRRVRHRRRPPCRVKLLIGARATPGRRGR